MEKEKKKKMELVNGGREGESGGRKNGRLMGKRRWGMEKKWKVKGEEKLDRVGEEGGGGERMEG